MTDLSTLLSRVESGSGADRELDAAIEHAQRFLSGIALGLKPEHIAVWRHVGGGYVEDSGTRYPAPAYTADLNAVVALVEARLPGACWRIEKLSDAMKFGNRDLPDFWASCGLAGEQEMAYAPTPARALLAALIRAEMERRHEP